MISHHTGLCQECRALVQSYRHLTQTLQFANPSRRIQPTTLRPIRLRCSDHLNPPCYNAFHAHCIHDGTANRIERQNFGAIWQHDTKRDEPTTTAAGATTAGPRCVLISRDTAGAGPPKKQTRRRGCLATRGEVARPSEPGSVEAEIADLTDARPGLAAIARAMARLLDNPKAVSSRPPAAKVLTAVSTSCTRRRRRTVEAGPRWCGR